MDIRTEQENGCTVFYISGKLDASTAGELENRFNEILDENKGNVVVSMAAMEYVSSAGLRVILSFAKQLHAQNNQIRFAGLGGSVKSVFEISGFYALFPIFETVRDAITDA